MSAPVISNIDALYSAAASVLRVTDSVKVKRAAVLVPLADAGQSESAIAARLNREADAGLSRSSVNFYVRTGRLYGAAGVDSPALFGDLWKAVTRVKGLDDAAILATIVPGDVSASRKALAAAVKAVADAADEAAKAAKDEARTAERIAEETSAGDIATDGAHRDYAATLAGMREHARKTSPEEFRRYVIAVMAEVDALQAIARQAKARKAA